MGVPRSEKSHLLSRHSEGLRIIYLSRPRNLNALDAETVTRLRKQLEALDTNPAVSAVVVKGREDRVFCTGTDYRAFWEAARGDSAQRKRVIEYMREEYALQWLVHTMTKPVVVVGHGVTSSTGLALAANARFGYATASTRVIIPEVSMGLVPSGGASYHLARTRSGVGMFATLTSLPVSGEVAYWGGLLPYATTGDIVEGLLPDVGGHLANAPLRAADLWADPQYRKALATLRSGMPEEKAEWLTRAAEQATDPIAFDRLVDLEMWHKAIKVGRPDIANDIAEGALEGEEPDYEGLFPISLSDAEDGPMSVGMGIDWYEGREALGFDGVATPVDAFDAAANDEAGTAAASLAAQWDAIPNKPSREALYQLQAIERCFGGSAGKGDPVLAARADVRPARGGGSFVQAPPDAAREALDAASRARLQAAAAGDLFDVSAGRRMGLTHGVTPAEEAVRRRWRRVADRASRPEYWRERAAARAGLTVTPPRPDAVRMDDPHSGLARLSGRPKPPAEDWESHLGALEGSVTGQATGVHAAVLAAHEALGLPARRVSPASRSRDPESVEATARNEEMRLRTSIDGAVRAGVHRAWPLGWLPASLTAEMCERAGAPSDPDTRAIVRFATAVATARIHGQPDLALIPRQHWEAQRAEELRRRVAPGRMSDRQWARLQKQFPFLVQHLFEIEPRSVDLPMQLAAADRFAARMITAQVRAQADAGVRFLVEEARRRGVPLRGPAATLAKDLGIGAPDATGVALVDEAGVPLNGAGEAYEGRKRKAGKKDVPIAAEVLDILEPQAQAELDAEAAIEDAGRGLSGADVRELRELRNRLAGLVRRIDADRSRAVVDGEAAAAAEESMRQAGSSSGASLSPEAIEALEAAEAAGSAEAEGRAMPAPLEPADVAAMLTEATAIRERMHELHARQAEVVEAMKRGLIELDPKRASFIAGQAEFLSGGRQAAAGAAEAGSTEPDEWLKSDEATATTDGDQAALLTAAIDALERKGQDYVPSELEIISEAHEDLGVKARKPEAVVDIDPATDGARVRPSDIPHAPGAVADLMARETEGNVDRIGRPMPRDPAGPNPTTTSDTAMLEVDDIESIVAEDMVAATRVEPMAVARYLTDKSTDEIAIAENDGEADDLEADANQFDIEVDPEVGSALDQLNPFAPAESESDEENGVLPSVSDMLPGSVYARSHPFRQQLDTPVDVEWQPRLGQQSEWTAPPEFLDPALMEPENFALAAHREPLAFLNRYDPSEPTHDDGFVVPGRLGINLGRAEEGVLPRAVRFSAADPAARRQDGPLTAAMSAAIGADGAPADKGMANPRRVRQVADSLRKWYRQLLDERRKQFKAMRPVKGSVIGRPKDRDGKVVPLVDSDPGMQQSLGETMAQAAILVRAINQTVPSEMAAVEPMARLGVAARLGRDEARSRTLFEEGSGDREKFAQAAEELGMTEEAAAARSAEYTPLFTPDAIAAASDAAANRAASSLHEGLKMARALLTPAPDVMGVMDSQAREAEEAFGGVDPAGAMEEAGLVPSTHFRAGSAAGNSGSVAFAAGDVTPADAYVSAGLAVSPAPTAAGLEAGAVEPAATGLADELRDVPGFAVLDDSKRKAYAAEAVARAIGTAPTSSGKHVRGGFALEAPVRANLVAQQGSLGLFAHGEGTFEPWGTGGDWAGASDIDRRPTLARAHLPGLNSGKLAQQAWIDQAYRANQFAHGRVVMGGNREAAARERVVDKATDALAAFESARAAGSEDAAKGVLATLLQSMALDLDPIVQATRSLVGASGMTYPSLEAHDQAILALRAGFHRAHAADEAGVSRSVDAELPSAAASSVDLAAYGAEIHRLDVARRGLSSTLANPAHEGGIRGPQDLASDIVASPPVDSDASIAITTPLAGEAAASLPDAPRHVRDPAHGGVGTGAKVAEMTDLLKRVSSERTREVLRMAGITFESLTRASLRREGLREAVAEGASAPEVVAARTALARLTAAADESQRAGMLDPAADAATRATTGGQNAGAASRGLFGSGAAVDSKAAKALAPELGAPVRAGDGTAGSLAAKEAGIRSSEAGSSVAVDDATRAAGFAVEADGRPPVGSKTVDPLTGAQLPGMIDEAARAVHTHNTWLDARGYSHTAAEAEKAATDAILAEGSSRAEDIRIEMREMIEALEEETGVELSVEMQEEMINDALKNGAPRLSAEVADVVALKEGIKQDADVYAASTTDPFQFSESRAVIDDSHLSAVPPGSAATAEEIRHLKQAAFGAGSLRLYGEAAAATVTSPHLRQMVEDMAASTEVSSEEEARVVNAWALDRVAIVAEQALDARLIGRPDLAELKDMERERTAAIFGVPDPGPLSASAWLSQPGMVDDQLRGRLQERFAAFERQAEAEAHVQRFGQAPEWAGPELRARLIGVSPETARATGEARMALSQAVPKPAAAGEAPTVEAALTAFTETIAALPAFGPITSRLSSDEASEVVATVKSSLASEKAFEGLTAAEAEAGAGKSVLATTDDAARRETLAAMQEAAAASEAIARGEGSAADAEALGRFQETELSAPARAAARIAVMEAKSARSWLDKEVARGASGAEAWAAMARLTKARAALQAIVAGDQGTMAAWLEGWQADRRRAAALAGVSAESAFAAEVQAAAPAHGFDASNPAVSDWLAQPVGDSFGATPSARAQAALDSSDPAEQLRRAQVNAGVQLSLVQAQTVLSSVESTPVGLGFARRRLDDPALSHEEIQKRLLARELAGDDELAHGVTATEGRLGPEMRQPRAPDGTPILIDEASYVEAASMDVDESLATQFAGQIALAKRPLARLGAEVRPPSTRGPIALDVEAEEDLIQSTPLSDMDATASRYDPAGELADATGGKHSGKGSAALAPAEPAIMSRTPEGAGLEVLHHSAMLGSGSAGSAAARALTQSQEGTVPSRVAFDRMGARVEPVQQSWLKQSAASPHTRAFPALAGRIPAAPRIQPAEAGAPQQQQQQQSGVAAQAGSATTPAARAAGVWAVPASQPGSSSLSAEAQHVLEGASSNATLSGAKARESARAVRDLEAHVRAMLVQEARFDAGDVSAAHPFLADFVPARTAGGAIVRGGFGSQWQAEGSTAAAAFDADKVVGGRLKAGTPLSEGELARAKADLDLIYGRTSFGASPAELPPVPAALTMLDSIAYTAERYSSSVRAVLPAARRSEALSLARETIAASVSDAELVSSSSIEAAVRDRASAKGAADQVVELAVTAAKAAVEAVESGAVRAPVSAEGSAPAQGAVDASVQQTGTVLRGLWGQPAQAVEEIARQAVEVARVRATAAIASDLGGRIAAPDREGVTARFDRIEEAAANKPVTVGLSLARAHRIGDSPVDTVATDVEHPTGSVGEMRASVTLDTAAGIIPTDRLPAAEADPSLPMNSPYMVGLPTPPPAAVEVGLDGRGAEFSEIDAFSTAGESGLDSILRISAPHGRETDTFAAVSGISAWAQDQPEVVRAVNRSPAEVPRVLRNVIGKGMKLASLEALERRALRRRAAAGERLRKMVLRSGAADGVDASAYAGASPNDPNVVADAAAAAVWREAAEELARIPADAHDAESRRVDIRLNAAARAGRARVLAMRAASASGPTHAMPVADGDNPVGGNGVTVGRHFSMSEALLRSARVSQWARLAALELADSGKQPSTVDPLTADRLSGAKPSEGVVTEIEDALLASEALLEEAAGLPGRRSAWAAVLLNELRSRNSSATMGSISIGALGLPGRYAVARLLGDAAARGVGVRPDEAARVEALLRRDGLVAPATEAADMAVEAAVDAQVGDLAAESPRVQAAYRAICLRIFKLGGPVDDLNPAEASSGRRDGLAEPQGPPMDKLDIGGTVAERELAAAEQGIKQRERAAAIAELRWRHAQSDAGSAKSASTAAATASELSAAQMDDSDSDSAGALTGESDSEEEVEEFAPAEEDIRRVVKEMRLARAEEVRKEEEALAAMRKDVKSLAAQERAEDAEIILEHQRAQMEWGNGRDPSGRRWSPFPGNDEEGDLMHLADSIAVRRMSPTALLQSNPHRSHLGDDTQTPADHTYSAMRKAVSSLIAGEASDALAGAAGAAAQVAAARQLQRVEAALAGQHPHGASITAAASETADAAEGRGAGSRFSVAGTLPIWAEVGGVAASVHPDAMATHPEVTRRRAAELAHYHEKFVRGRDREAAALGWADTMDADKSERDRLHMRRAMEAEGGVLPQTASSLSDEARARVTHDPDQLIHAMGLPLEPRVEAAARSVTDRFEVLDDWRTAVPLPRSVEEVRRRLKSEDTPFARDALRAMDKAPQRAVHAAHRLLVESGRSSLARAMQTEWRVNSRLRNAPDFMEAAGPRLFGGNTSEAREFLPGVSDAEIDALFQPLSPGEELVLGRREHIQRTRDTEQRRHEWEERALDALERGEGDGYLGELFRRRYDYIFDPDHHVFDVNHEFKAEAAMRGRSDAERRGFVDARTASILLRKGLPAAQGELRPTVHPRALAQLGTKFGKVDPETNQVTNSAKFTKLVAKAAARNNPGQAPGMPEDAHEMAMDLGLVSDRAVGLSHVMASQMSKAAEATSDRA
ncbi:hypothetical protein FNF27_02029 [Cafeteria roenbergensis]|uniref:3-hydroxyisobutyryl-CoA hydrolase n=1 Tax=Cafeteria roenbergensis TaxID=33653 RepID=A0A5A8EFM9_CAFRO|nr:hypothetical protein FNF27_02029 [Cafeteria roenbergensis]